MPNVQGKNRSAAARLIDTSYQTGITAANEYATAELLSLTVHCLSIVKLRDRRQVNK